mmetsp:Transcript_55054/g.61514  ORF Transcript_55054/g.61514 Transcript_55054/m.61514 type:complete len:199 (+) Transcript_55054:154-750(+)
MVNLLKCNLQEINVKQYTDIIQDLLSDQVNTMITTDGGGKISALYEVRWTANSHWYELNTTASDASSQNGIVQQPHTTLKDTMRCMLYSARLGTESWADVIMHATWLYNRTYHRSIKIISIQAYLGQIPALNSLIIFGAKLTAEKPGTRPTATNLWIYDEISLGYQNTMQSKQPNMTPTTSYSMVTILKMDHQHQSIF